jgi:splicing factor 3A subunit 2
MRLVADGKHSLDDNAMTLSAFDGLGHGSTVSLLLRLRGGIDFQHREGSKFGGGGVMSESQAASDRKERLRKLALETIDLDKDPYFMKNHLGTFECKLCLTLHTTEGNYLAHTQGKRHQQNLARRAAREEQMGLAAKPQTGAAALASGKATIKIGRPGYKVTKSRDPASGQRTLMFEVDYPEAEEGTQPRHRFMSSYEQRVEAPDKAYQYLLFACEPYETVGFKIPNEPLDKGEGRFFTSWDDASRKFTLQLHFMTPAEVAALAQASSGSGGAPKRQIRALAAGVLA